MRSLQDELFPAPAFRAWLAKVASVVPLSWSAEARRFRPGLDYTLATSEESEARLDVVLGLTPEVKVEAEEEAEEGTAGAAPAASVSASGAGGAKRKNGKEKEKVEVNGWQSGEWGGWECYMAPHEEEDDPAVYRSGGSKKTKQPPAKSLPPSPAKSNGTSGGGGGDNANGASGDIPSSPDAKKSAKANGSAAAKADAMEMSDPSDGESDEEEDDGTLLTVQPGFNRLLLVLRDEKVMRFVKYVSAAAEGSRWDVCGEYEIGMLEEEEEEE